MALSIFDNKDMMPDNKILAHVLDGKFKYWNEIKDYTYQKYPEAKELWNFSGKKYGWGFRILDKKRAILYLIPCDNYFMIAFVYGQKATNEALDSNISNEIKEIISSAKVYAEGRGFRIDILDSTKINDIKLMIDIKLRH